MRTAEEIKEQVEKSGNYWVMMTVILELLLDIRGLLLEKEVK